VSAWIEHFAQETAARAEREISALVAVSTPSGDRDAAEEAVAVVSALLPPEAQTERVPCSTPGHAADLVVRVAGARSGGGARILLVGHLDTVVAHAEHRPLTREDGRLVGSGSIDMKGGDVLALGVLRALAARREDFAEAALLLVNDEEWRVGEFAHAGRFAGFDACLCFEAGQTTDDGEEAVVVRRKAAGTIRVRAAGRSSHSGSAPGKGINALLAVAEAARVVATCNDPHGPDRLTAVPTVLRSGDAFNVVPAAGELICDVRADRLEAFEGVLEALPPQVGGATVTAEMVRRWPGMDSREATAGVLALAAGLTGAPVVAADRGGASDASHFAASIPVTIDGLGPRGGGAHAPHEYVLEASITPRARLALAVAEAVLHNPAG
jgi:glutamate carboxypeptidase